MIAGPGDRDARALDSRVSPARALLRYLYDEPGEHFVDRWPAGPLRIGPSLAHEAAVPAQDGVRSDQAMPPQAWGSRRIRAASTARSAQSRRGRGWVRRSTATSCRKMSSSTSLVEDVRAISRTSPSTCWKIR